MADRLENGGGGGEDRRISEDQEYGGVGYCGGRKSRADGWLTGGSKVGAAMGGIGVGLLWLGGDGEDRYAEQND
jgi:hypothetical protein